MATKYQMQLALGALKRRVKKHAGQLLDAMPEAGAGGQDQQRYTTLCEGMSDMLEQCALVFRQWRRQDAEPKTGGGE